MKVNGQSPFRFQRYQALFEKKGEIMAEWREIAKSLDKSGVLAAKVGMLGGSGGPPVLGAKVRTAIDAGSRKLMKLDTLDDRIRALIKQGYGDEWDGVALSTAEAGLWVTYESLVTPPLAVRGDKYPSTYLTPYERHSHHQAGYGAPFPPWRKDHTADRGVTAGELGIMAKRLENVRTVFVPLVGARYECHGLKYYPAVLLLGTDAEGSAAKIRQTAARHADSLAAIVSMAYDSPGYGYGTKTPQGVPVLQAAMGELAAEYNIPYIIDNARGTPFVGLDPRHNGAAVVIYSADKAFGGPTGGLIIGREEFMVPIRRALGVHGNRWGTPSSHGKAGYVQADPGKEALLGIVAALEVLLEEPDLLTRPVDRLAEITETIAAEELGELSKALVITHSDNSGAVEINYEKTWETDWPIPIFPIEDYYSSGDLIMYGLSGAGISPPLCYDANLVVGPLSNLCEADGVLSEERAEFVLRTMFRGIRRLTERFNQNQTLPLPALEKMPS